VRLADVAFEDGFRFGRTSEDPDLLEGLLLTNWLLLRRLEAILFFSLGGESFCLWILVYRHVLVIDIVEVFEANCGAILPLILRGTLSTPSPDTISVQGVILNSGNQRNSEPIQLNPARSLCHQQVHLGFLRPDDYSSRASRTSQS